MIDTNRKSIVDLGPITSPYGDTSGRSIAHNGVDIGVPVGTPLQSQVGGQVERTLYDQIGGTQVIVRTPQGYEEVFAHLSNVAVSIGDTLEAGQLIGYSGQSGTVTGPHVHYEIRPPSGQGTVDPMTFLSEFVPGFASEHASPSQASGAGAPSARTVSASSSAPASAQKSSDPCPGGGALTQIGPATFCRYQLGPFPFFTPANTGDAPGVIQGIGTVVSTITDPKRWAQIAFTLAGVGLIVTGVLLYTKALTPETVIRAAGEAAA